MVLFVLSVVLSSCEDGVSVVGFVGSVSVVLSCLSVVSSVFFDSDGVAEVGFVASSDVNAAVLCVWDGVDCVDISVVVIDASVVVGRSVVLVVGAVAFASKMSAYV